MKGLSAFLLKAALLPGAVCAPALVPVDAGAAAWDYVYTPTALPDGYPGGAWDLEAYGDAAPSIVNGRLYFNLRNGLFFYGRGREADPRISASDFTFEWRQEVLRPGNQFSMAMYYAEDPYNWIEFMRQNDGGIMFADGTVIMLPESPATGPHTYRLVKSDSQVELYVDGALTGSLPAGAHTVDYLELSGWGAEYAPYEAYWDHVAYTRGAYTPAELPSPTASTTTCVEVTGVPNWKQFDDGTNNWWDDIYNHTTSSISKSGCALTAVSQVITKQWQNTDPGELNSILRLTPGGFRSGGRVNFEVVAQLASLGYAEGDFTALDEIHTKLEAGNPVILWLWSLKARANGIRPSHFVVAVGKCGDTIYINDPGHSSIYTGRPTLEQYFNRLPVDLREIRALLYYD